MHTQFQQKIGYCPQFDALLELMTGREMLYLFARLRGIPGNEIHGVVEALIKLVNLEEYAGKKCGIYRLVPFLKVLKGIDDI